MDDLFYLLKINFNLNWFYSIPIFFFYGIICSIDYLSLGSRYFFIVYVSSHFIFIDKWLIFL